ncbi:MAG: hypothetical protein AAF726_22415 [Planctomycetota bacterium]
MLTLIASLALAAPSPAQNGVVTYIGPALFKDPAVDGDWGEYSITTQDGPETFGLYMPTQTFEPQAPLLVHFHAWRGGHPEVGAFTDFMWEAEQRGWILVCPDQDVPGLDRATYGNDEAQRRFKAVIDWATSQPFVNPNKVYAYGFSMGGGDVLSYAAQSLDPDGVVFAAIAQNAGTLCLAEEYGGNLDARSSLELAMGGTPSQMPFAYRRASSLDYDDLLGFDLSLDHTARNLARTPIETWYSNNDRALLRDFSENLDLVVDDHTIHRRNTRRHDWDTFDYAAVCDWFEGKERTIRQSGELVVARDARYFDVWVEREDPAAFGRMAFDLEGDQILPNDALLFTDLENISSLRVDALITGVPRTFLVQLEADVDEPRTFYLDGYGDGSISDAPPSFVLLRLGGAFMPAVPGVHWTMEGSTLVLSTPRSASAGELASWVVFGRP